MGLGRLPADANSIGTNLQSSRHNLHSCIEAKAAVTKEECQVVEAEASEQARPL